MIPPNNLRELSVAVRARRLTPVEHVADVLDRLGTDPYNVVITLDKEGALTRAASLTEELAQGRWRGPLHGVAVGVKDVIDVAGLPTRCGSMMFGDAPAATVDAPVVARLKQAGAVIVAKLHTHEFAYGPTGDVAATGPARNPHDPRLITGGSSSGSAAAVAAGYLPLALGTDTGGSVRTPAALCGVVGLKPTLRKLPTAGVFPLSKTCDHVGLIAANVHGAALGWDTVCDVGNRAGGTQTANVRADLEGVVVGVLVDDYWRPEDSVLSAALAEAAQLLNRHGARVVEVSDSDDRGSRRDLPGDRRGRGVRETRCLAGGSPRGVPAVHSAEPAVIRRPAHPRVRWGAAYRPAALGRASPSRQRNRRTPRAYNSAPRHPHRRSVRPGRRSGDSGRAFAARSHAAVQPDRLACPIGTSARERPPRGSAACRNSFR